MPITLKGIRLESLTLEREDKTGNTSIKSASYSLLSSTDHVLANQTIGGYGQAVAVNPSADTLGKLNEFVTSYKKDLTTVLGLDEG